MDFRISDTFTDSLSRLTGDEQKAVKTTSFDLQLSTSHNSLSTSPGMQLHKLDRAKDANFWSVRVSRDVRVIVHENASLRHAFSPDDGARSGRCGGRSPPPDAALSRMTNSP